MQPKSAPGGSQSHTRARWVEDEELHSVYTQRCTTYRYVVMILCCSCVKSVSVSAVATAMHVQAQYLELQGVRYVDEFVRKKEGKRGK